MRSVLLGALLLLPLTGGGEPIVRVSAEPERVRVGEAVELEVQVLVPTWFTQPTRYPSFELANAITRLPPDSTFPSSAIVDGERWSGITRRYRVRPLLGARYEFDGLELAVHWFDPALRGPRAVSVPVPAVSFLAEVPEGAEALRPYLAGSTLVLGREAESPVDGLEVGDAIVLRYRAELDGLPAIFLPPLVDVDAQPGMSAYVDEVDLDDGPVASRTERVTLVFDRPGRYRAPGVELRWWDVAAGEIGSSRIEPLEILVAGAPEPTEHAMASDGAALRRVFGAAVALAVLLVLGRRFGPRLHARFEVFRARREASEARAFARLRAALASGDARAVHAALLVWVGRLGVRRDLRAFARGVSSPVLERELDALLAARFAASAPAVDYAALRTALTEVRAGRHRVASSSGDLPTLNPGR
jgi:hypothetical protein